MKIAIINGPNLNLLGRRETDIYGNLPFEEYLAKLEQKFPHIRFSFFQSNIEGELIDEVQRVGFNHDGIIINPGGDRKSTRLNSSHGYISYAVFCLKKKNHIT